MLAVDSRVLKQALQLSHVLPSGPRLKYVKGLKIIERRNENFSGTEWLSEGRDVSLVSSKCTGKTVEQTGVLCRMRAVWIARLKNERFAVAEHCKKVFRMQV